MRDERLFSAAIIHSGLLPLCGVLTEQEYQVIYDKMLDELQNSKDLSPKERLQQLIQAD